jgi:hypothetical protein
VRGLPFEVKALLSKARESAILAVETYNRPSATFRSGAYSVLMNIAWSALFHAMFVRKHIKPYYRKANSRKYIKIDGEYKRWELSECLNQHFKGDNPAVRKNLEFFIKMRNRIEHSTLAELDPEFFGECQAMLLNFEQLLVTEFGERHVIRAGLTFALQFSKFTPRLPAGSAKPREREFKQIKQLADAFRSSLSMEVKNDLAYSFKVYLVPKVGNHASGDTVAVEFVKYDPSKPEEMARYEKVVAMIKEKEKTIAVANLGRLKPSAVVRQVGARLGKPFTHHDHMLCYLHFKTRPAGNASDPMACDSRHCAYDEVHKDYSYSPDWVEFLVERLNDPATYALITRRGTAGQQPASVAGAAA